jgi:hypothetical protein
LSHISAPRIARPPTSGGYRLSLFDKAQRRPAALRLWWWRREVNTSSEQNLPHNLPYNILNPRGGDIPCEQLDGIRSRPFAWFVSARPVELILNRCRHEAGHGESVFVSVGINPLICYCSRRSCLDRTSMSLKMVTPYAISVSLAPRSVARLESPVRFAPGRARLATRPAATGSDDTGNTIGIAAVAFFAANAASVPIA